MLRRVLVSLCLVVLLISSFTVIVYAGTTFHSKTTLINMFKTLCDTYPSKASYSIIGKSYNYQNIYIFKIGNPNGGRILWDGQLHGWEDIGSEVQYLITKWLLTSNTPEANRILERNYVLFVPIINVDSTERGNSDFSNGATYGVDLDRNFPTGFNYTSPPGTAELPYPGTAAGSEPETKALRYAFQVYRPQIYVNTHYGGGPWLQSYTNNALTNWIKTRIQEISVANGFNFPWSMSSGFAGDGMAVAEANNFGANSWLWEIAANSGDPYKTGPGFDCYMHNTQTMTDVQTWYFPRMLPAFQAMCETIEKTTINANEYQLNVLQSEGGSTIPLAGTYTYSLGSTISITAYNNSGWQFSYWLLDNVDFGSANPLSCTIDSDHTIQAIYVPNSTIKSTISTSQYQTRVKLTVLPADGGWTNPSAGAYTYTSQSIISINAYNKAGYKFSYWSLDGINVGASNPLRINMNKDRTIRAEYTLIQKGAGDSFSLSNLTSRTHHSSTRTYRYFLVSYV